MNLEEMAKTQALMVELSRACGIVRSLTPDNTGASFVGVELVVPTGFGDCQKKAVSLFPEKLEAIREGAKAPFFISKKSGGHTT